MRSVLTRQVRLLGTPAYMPPERIGDPSCVDARTDVYGVGALIYFLVAGRLPFAGDDAAAVLRAVLSESPPDLALAVPGVPAPLAELVTRCLAKAPADRPATVQPIVATLEALVLPPWTREDAQAWWRRWRSLRRRSARGRNRLRIVRRMKIPKRLQPLVEEVHDRHRARWQLMSGKEAMVFVVRSGHEVRCAKVYKEADKRSFRQAVDYTENRKTRNSRAARAMAKGTLDARRRKPRGRASGSERALPPRRRWRARAPPLPVPGRRAADGARGGCRR